MARAYEELNRETKYFEALMRLFDLYLAAGRMKEACEALDRLVDIDPYDYRNQERMREARGKCRPGFSPERAFPRCESGHCLDSNRWIFWRRFGSCCHRRPSF